MIVNRMVKIAALFVALASVFSFSQEEKELKFGIRAGFSLYDFSSGNKETDRYIEMGYGFGAGLVINIPITPSLSFVPEVNLLYRKPFYLDAKNIAGYEAWVTEFAISIPAMLQFMPVENVPFYLSAGIQLEIPIASEETMKASGFEITQKYKERASIDFGIPLGIGCFIVPNIGIDVRALIGITNPDEDLDDSSFNTYGLGISYFF